VVNRRKRKRKKGPKTPEQIERLKRRYAGKLVRLGYDDRHFAGYWIGEIPSVNELTLDVHRIRRRAPTVPVKVFKAALFSWLTQYAAYAPLFQFYELDIAVWIPLYHSNNDLVMRDVSNFIKVSEDSICQAIGRDDRFHLDVLIHKRNLPQGQQPHWTFVLTGREHEQHEKEGEFKAIRFKGIAEAGGGFEPQEPVQRKGKG
jgi:hypothetical protein